MTATQVTPFAFDWRRLARSVTTWALLPLGVYLLTSRAFPSTSLVPVLAAALIPALGVAASLARRRDLDAIALVALLDIVATLLVTALAPHARAVLIGNALGIGVLGLAFVVSVPAGAPLASLFAKQFANLPAYRDADPRRRSGYAQATLRWGIALVALCCAHVAIAATAPAAAYFALKPLLTLLVVGGMLAWTARTLRSVAG